MEIALRSDTTLLGARTLRRLLSEPDLLSIFDDAAYIVEQCLESEHFQVVERTLFLWNNDYLANHLFKSSASRMRGVFRAIEKDRAHWNPIVRRLSEEVAQLYAGDQNFIEAIRGQPGEPTDRQRNKRDTQERYRMWEEMAKAAARNTV